MQKSSWPSQARSFASALVLALVMIVAGHGEARSQPAVCAEVKIQIQQRISMERQAFDAVLKINNGLTGISIVDIAVEIKFFDEAGNGQDGEFFVRLDDFDGEGNVATGTGIVPPQTSASARWLIIPSPDAGGANSIGKRYGVGAVVHYRRLDAGATEPGELISVTLAPETIVVRPQPRLYLDYFLPFDVHGDDPFTPDVEPSEPFTLGVRVKNVGYGDAVNLSIESAQPEIIENELGLLVDFEILGGYVQDAQSSPSLLLNFGNIEREGGSKVGRWEMITSLSGQFRELNVSYTHADTLGGALTSLIANPNGEIPGHRLIKDVLVEVNGRDNVHDFLAYTAGPDGGASDVIRVYESQGMDTEVTRLFGPPTAIQPNGAGAHVLTLGTTPAKGEIVYVRLASPYGTQIPELTVTRTGDASVLPSANAWVSKSRIDNGGQPGWEYHINLFDAKPQSSYTIVANNVVLPGEINGRVYVHHDKQPPDLAPPLAGVLVLLEGQSAAGDPFSRTTTTAHLGRFRFGDVPAGTYQLQVADVDGYSNGAHVVGSAGGTVSGDQINGITLSNGQVATGYAFVKLPLQTVDEADLQVTVQAPTAAVTVGEPFPVIITLDNSGPAAAQAVSVTVNLPPDLGVYSFDAATGVFNSASRTWLLDGVPVGDSVQLNLQLTATSEGAHALSIEAMHLAPDVVDPDSGNNIASATVQAQQPQSQLTLEVGLMPQPPRVLALVACPESSSPLVTCSLAAEASQMAALLGAVGVSHLIETSHNNFLGELQTGYWNTILISSAANPGAENSPQPLSEQLLREIAAYVHAGAGLIVEGGLESRRDSDALPPESIELLLGSYQDIAVLPGQHPDLYFDPLVLPPGPYEVEGYGYGLQTIDAQSVGAFGVNGQSVATEVERSAGRAIALGFRLLDIPDVTARNTLTAALLARVNPMPELEATTGDDLNLSAEVSNGEEAGGFTLGMQAQGNDLFLDSDPISFATRFPSPYVTWHGVFIPGQAVGHNAILRIFSGPGLSQVDVTLTDTESSEQRLATITIPILSIEDFAARAHAALTQEQLTDPDEIAAQSTALAELDDALLAISVEYFALAKILLLGTIETLADITSVDLGHVRSDIGKAVRALNRMVTPSASTSACPNRANDLMGATPAGMDIERPDGVDDDSEPAAADCHED